MFFEKVMLAEIFCLILASKSSALKIVLAKPLRKKICLKFNIKKSVE